ncbi:MAG: hypothetical protein NVS1B11_34970 [Terriglobales bacterium]
MSVPIIENRNFNEISSGITKIFAEGPSTVSVTKATLQLLADRLGWDVAAFWIVNDLLVVLECADFYARREAVQNFETVTRARQFYCGEELPGLAWLTREPVHIPVLSENRNFPRAWIAKGEKLISGMAFPLYAGKRVLGAIEFFSRQVRDVTPGTREFLCALGGQIGMYLERLSAGIMFEAATAEFHLVAQASSLAIFTVNEHSDVLFANNAVETIFGYSSKELVGGKLTKIMPEYLRRLHEEGLARYVASGTRHLNWDGIALPGLHKNGQEIPLEVSFGEFKRDGKRVFTGFVRLRDRDFPNANGTQ